MARGLSCDKIDDDEGDKENVYSEEGSEEGVESGAIEPAEEGFVEGYEGKVNVKCDECGKILGDEDEVVEEVVSGKLHRFCSNICAENFESNVIRKKIKK